MDAFEFTNQKSVLYLAGICPSEMMQTHNEILNGSLALGLNKVVPIKDSTGAPMKDLVGRIMLARTEQAPNPDSRVVLSNQRDALGLNRVRLNWNLMDLDRRSIEVLVAAFAAEMGRLNIGRVRLREWLTARSSEFPTSFGHHHMGTTRMSDNPTTGVVDRNCQLHGVNNLYVAGSSVFATSGYANPTLTIVALALRLADHLKSQNQ